MGHDLDLLQSRDVIGHVTIRLQGPLFYGWSIVTTRLSSTDMEIWPFEVLPGTEVGRQLVLNITLISYTPLRYVRNVVREE